MYIVPEKYEPDSQAGIEPLGEKTKAFKNVCEAAEKLGRSLKGALMSLIAIKETEDPDVEEFQKRVAEVRKDLKYFGDKLKDYNNIANSKLNIADVMTNLKLLNAAVSNADAVFTDYRMRSKRYSNNTVKNLIDEIQGNGGFNRNSLTGKLEAGSIGLIREFIELADKFLGTVNTESINQLWEYNQVRLNIDHVLGEIINRQFQAAPNKK